MKRKSKFGEPRTHPPRKGIRGANCAQKRGWRTRKRNPGSQAKAYATKQKTREREGPARVGDFENKETLPGNESSPACESESALHQTGPEAQPDDEGRSRRKYRPSDREADPQSGATRVRFEFARRAHQRENTPRLGINRAARGCQEERDVLEGKSEEISRGTMGREDWEEIEYP